MCIKLWLTQSTQCFFLGPKILAPALTIYSKLSVWCFVYRVLRRSSYKTRKRSYSVASIYVSAGLFLDFMIGQLTALSWPPCYAEDWAKEEGGMRKYVENSIRITKQPKSSAVPVGRSKITTTNLRNKFLCFCVWRLFNVSVKMTPL